MSSFSRPPTERPSASRRTLVLIVCALAVCALVLVAESCGDSCEEGAAEIGGPQCCSAGCGNNASVALPRKCKGNAWVCEGKLPVLLQNCASQSVGCQQKTACSGTPVEADPAPELCCDLSCDGAAVQHRVCGPNGVNFVCPAGFVPISQCADPVNACGGAVAKYRANNFKLP